MRLESSAAGQLEFEQRSFLFRFPDLVSVRFLPLGESQSTLVIYSRSLLGYSDLGVNRSRVRNWLDALDKSLESTR